jgi:hypothetical protein
MVVLVLRMHLFVFRTGLGLFIDENRQKGSKEDSYPKQQCNKHFDKSQMHHRIKPQVLKTRKLV